MALNPENQSWNTPAYQACVGARIQKCGATASEEGWTQAQTALCIDTAQGECIAAQGATTWKWIAVASLLIGGIALYARKR